MKSKGSLKILVPGLTIFFSSACIMIIELVAGRLISRSLGSSLYTWTSVIGIVLAGITAGNYFGGKIADKYPAQKVLSILFIIASAACVSIVILNNIVGEWTLLWFLKFPVRVFCHVALIFLVPSAILGMVSPVVAKMALDKGLSTGKTVGNIYAWGAAGSIIGTFLAGFFLISAMGTIAIIWTVGAVLLAMGIIYWLRCYIFYIWAVIFSVLMLIGLAPGKWMQQKGSSFNLRTTTEEKIIYEDETRYCRVFVEKVSSKPDKRIFYQDYLVHSMVLMDEPQKLLYFYSRIYAALMHGVHDSNEPIKAMVIGGGGYVYPRYIEKFWPGSRIDVVEIDPGVTKAATEAFGLSKDTSINTINMDARNYVDQLISRQDKIGSLLKYDFIFGDAFNDVSVPYQLVTQQFNDKLARLLSDDGVYMLNMIDIFKSRKFLSSVVKTLEKTFDYVYILWNVKSIYDRSTFVIAASNKELNVQEYVAETIKDRDIRYIGKNEIQKLIQNPNAIKLTDDYAPVEQLLLDVVRQKSIGTLSQKYSNLAGKLRRKGKLDESLTVYNELLLLDNSRTMEIYDNISGIRITQGRLNEALNIFLKAIEYGRKKDDWYRVGEFQVNTALILKKLGRNKESKKYLNDAKQSYRKQLSCIIPSHKTLFEFGILLIETGDTADACKYLKKTVEMNPNEIHYHHTLIKSLISSSQHTQALEQLQSSINLFTKNGYTEQVTQLQQQFESLLLENKR